MKKMMLLSLAQILVLNMAYGFSGAVSQDQESEENLLYSTIPDSSELTAQKREYLYFKALAENSPRTAIQMINRGQDPLVNVPMIKHVRGLGLPITPENVLSEDIVDTYSEISVLGWAIAMRNQELVKAMVLATMQINPNNEVDSVSSKKQMASMAPFWVIFGIICLPCMIAKGDDRMFVERVYFKPSAFAQKIGFLEIVPFLKSYGL